ncbi:acyl carrier protein phosphodiesterase [Caulobacter sp. AP07]|uniref:FMN-dependent NADH-azoreductase n=1 Tax=Caulobacter sp. AP07 TaxID=1144304 RepID=UPI0002722545|nr:FMN-dependent NADH-azoreductase [Caulobacter sp. AP07]EJL31283.1 acyl carrier protein phosphodiesterase [Caulobacter sp. AP07]
MKLLHIDSSILGAGSVSRTLSSAIVAAQRAQHPGLQVSYRDLAAQPVGHLSGAHLAAGQGAVPEDAALAADFADGVAVLEAFLAADIVVVGAPMYNFSIPTQLKAWIDRLAIAGRTFRYGANGVEGLAGGKTVIVASSRGGVYAEGTPMAAFDHQETYLRGVFNFFGITDVRFIRAEGVAMGDEQRARSVEGAEADILKLAA